MTMSDTGQVVFLCFMNNERSRGADMNMYLAVVMVLGKNLYTVSCRK